jgi:hypothetical protein
VRREVVVEVSGQRSVVGVLVFLFLGFWFLGSWFTYYR